MKLPRESVKPFKCLVLIGMPGSGKSQCALALAEVLEDTLLSDTDQMIEACTNSTIEEIFQNHGESYFRNLENFIIDYLKPHLSTCPGDSGKTIPFVDKTIEEKLSKSLDSLLKSLDEHKHLVLSTGGGLPITAGQMDKLKEFGLIAYLACDADVLARRLTRDNSRPLLKSDINVKPSSTDNSQEKQAANNVRKERIVSLLSAREKIYRQADIMIDTSFQTTDQTVNSLTKQFIQWKSSEEFC